MCSSDLCISRLVTVTPLPAFFVEPGYQAAYALRLGVGEWPYPFVDLQVAHGPAGDILLKGTDSYLTYIQDVALFTVEPGAEISSRALLSSSVNYLFTAERHLTSHGIAVLEPGVQDIHLGYVVDDRMFGWIHLNYTQQSGLSLVSSAMTKDDAGIYALRNTTIPAVDEASTATLAALGLLAMIGVRRSRPAPSQPCHS